MPGEAYIKFMPKGFHGERLQSLRTDGQRWRWWRLYCLSDQTVFPGLVAKNLAPLTEMEVVGSVYGSEEFNVGPDRLLVWRSEKEALVSNGLLKTAVVNGKEYLWNTNFHTFQDKHSRKGTRLVDRFYTEFLGLNDFDKAIYVLLLSKLEPEDVDLSTFCIPEFIPQFSKFVNGRLPLFGGGEAPETVIKQLTFKVSSMVSAFYAKAQEEGESATKDFVNWYCKMYQELKRSPYLRGGKDYKLVSEMLKVFSLNELKTLASRFLKEDDPFVKKAGYTIGVFKTMANRLVMKQDKRRIGIGDFSKYEKGL